MYAPFVQNVDNAIHWINLYPVPGIAIAIGFSNNYPLDSLWTYRYPALEQPGQARSQVFFYAVAIWPVTGQGFQNTKWPAVLYSYKISQNRKIPANVNYHKSI